MKRGLRTHKRGSFGCDLGQYNCLVLCLSSIPLFLGSCFEPNLILFCVFSNGCGLNSRELTHQSHCSFTSSENQLRALSKTNKPHKLSNWVRNLPLEPSHCPLISDYLLFPYFIGISITVSIFDQGCQGCLIIVVFSCLVRFLRLVHRPSYHSMGKFLPC